MLQTIQSDPSIQINDTADDYRRRVRELNDAFRTSKSPRQDLGRMMMTEGVLALGPVATVEIAMLVWRFNEFNEDNDPWQEHDFGAFDYNGQRIFWKIDYYDLTGKNASPDAADPTVTCRVLTVMLASEY